MDAAVKARAEKDAARKAAFAVRKGVFDGKDRAQRVAQAQAHLAAVLAPHAGKVLAGYMPMRSEIDPLSVMHGHAGPVCVPVIKAPATPLRFARYMARTPMVAGDFGALIPAALDWLVPQVLIVPLLAFDARGYRLGYGGGFYDRTLQGLRAQGPIVAIGFAFAGQKVDAVPIDATDQVLDMVVTESGVIHPQPIS